MNLFLFLSNLLIAQLALWLYTLGSGFDLIYVFSILVFFCNFLYSYNGKSQFSFFLIAYFLLFYLSPVLNLFSILDYSDYSRSIVSTYHVLNITSLHLACAVYVVIGTRARINSYILLDKKLLRKACYIYGILVAFTVLLMLQSVGGLKQALSMSRVDLKYVTKGKTLALWMTYLSALWFYIAPLYMLKTRKNILFWILFLTFFLVAEILFSAVFRNRTIPLMHTISILIAFYSSSSYLLYDRGNVRGRVSLTGAEPKKYLLMVVLFFAGVLAIIYRFVRGQLEAGGINLDLNTMVMMSIRGGDLGYTETTMRVLEYTTSNGIDLAGYSYYRFFGLFVPRAIWPDKPVTTDSLIGQWLTGLDVMTIPPGVFGDAYINFGLMGVLIFLIYGVVFGLLDRYYSKFTAYACYALTFTTIFHFVRGAFVNTVFIYLLSLLSIFLLKILLKPKLVEIV